MGLLYVYTLGGDPGDHFLKDLRSQAAQPSFPWLTKRSIVLPPSTA